MQKSKICNIVYTEQSTDIHKKEQRRAERRTGEMNYYISDLHFTA